MKRVHKSAAERRLSLARSFKAGKQVMSNPHVASATIESDGIGSTVADATRGFEGDFVSFPALKLTFRPFLFEFLRNAESDSDKSQQ